MKKGMLALTVLSCVLLVGAPACRHRKDQAQAPPKRVAQPNKTPEKKQKAAKKKQLETKKESAVKPKKPKQPSMSKKK